MPQAPVLSQEQRAVAFKRSLELRRERAGIKRWLLESGELAKQRFEIALTSEAVRGMKVIDLLQALPGIGKIKADRILERSRIPAKNTVRACGPRQIDRLFEHL